MGNWKLEKIMQGSCDSLRGAVLTYVPEYHVYRKGWDHEHCSVCSACIGELPGDEHSAYRNDSPPARMDWLCEDCYAEFGQTLGVTVDAHPALAQCAFVRTGADALPGEKAACEICTALIGRDEAYLQNCYTGRDTSGVEHILCARCHRLLVGKKT